MNDRSQALVLLAVARLEFKALGGMKDAAVFADEIFGFHAQQVAKKSIKAWLSLLGETYPTIWRFFWKFCNRVAWMSQRMSISPTTLPMPPLGVTGQSVPTSRRLTVK